MAHGHYIRFPATIRIENEYRPTKPYIPGVYLVLVQAPIRKVDKTVEQICLIKDAAVMDHLPAMLENLSDSSSSRKKPWTGNPSRKRLRSVESMGYEEGERAAKAPRKLGAARPVSAIHTPSSPPHHAPPNVTSQAAGSAPRCARLGARVHLELVDRVLAPRARHHIPRCRANSPPFPSASSSLSPSPVAYRTLRAPWRRYEHGPRCGCRAVGPRKVRRGEQGCDGRGVGNVKYPRRALRTQVVLGAVPRRKWCGVMGNSYSVAAYAGRWSWRASYSRCAKPMGRRRVWRARWGTTATGSARAAGEEGWDGAEDGQGARGGDERGVRGGERLPQVLGTPVVVLGMHPAACVEG
ncbi:hypothetical protein B0H14DRAFT_3151967 [Mycena olivaceomarginata]|nr:hypothetical protein B0H14DRAFT_3151967 [Mycena olivaceomarginata]